MSEQLFTQAQRVFDEFNKYLEIFHKEIGKNPVVQITNVDGKMLVYATSYQTQLLSFIEGLGNYRGIRFLEAENNE